MCNRHMASNELSSDENVKVRIFSWQGYGLSSNMANTSWIGLSECTKLFSNLHKKLLTPDKKEFIVPYGPSLMDILLQIADKNCLPVQTII